MLVKKFEEQVRKYPGNIAVKTEQESISYEDLSRLSNRVAHAIKSKFPGSGGLERLGLLFDHGPAMIIAILATLKAGKVYVPLSPDYPRKRLSYMLSDSGASIVMCDNDKLSMAGELAAELEIEVLNIDDIDESFPDRDIEDLLPDDRLAYVMYTSGSTGNPKGVKQTHKNASYYVRNWIRLFSITGDDRLTLFSSFCHDGSVQDLFAALHSGATLYPLYLRNRESSFELSDFLIRERITIWHSVPSLFSFFAGALDDEKQFDDLRFILLGGEEVREYEVRMFNRFFPHCRLANVYGQTESSVNSIHIYQPGEAYKKPLIGTSLDETEILLVDEEGGEVDALGKGEILVFSPYLSPGYWNNEEATRAVFSNDPEYGSMYWTGDMGRLLLDGNVEFLGRKDHQVKIRGFRIELGEIESRLLKLDDTREAAVAARENGKSNDGHGREDKYLCAYYTADQPIETGDLRDFLLKELPDYMIPSFFVHLERMPLTQSNKIDRKSLPGPETVAVARYVAPADNIEERLLDIWTEVLGVEKERIGVTGNFFDFGGHSLKAVSLVAKVHQLFDVRVPLTEVFNQPSVRQIAGYIKKADKDTYAYLDSVEKKDSYELSFNQRRLWIIDQVNPGNVQYNINLRIPLNGNIDVEVVKKCLSLLMNRHESMRTGFVDYRGGPRQFVLEGVELPFKFIDLTDLDELTKQKRREEVYHDACISPFDLSSPPLFRVLLVKPAQGVFDLIFTIHHIVSDGWSMQVLKDEFSRVYESIALGSDVDLAPLDFKYKDFAEWQQRQLTGNGDMREKSLRYWQDKIGEGFPTLALPYNATAGTGNGAGAGYRLALDRETKEGLNRMASGSRSTLFMVLFSAYNVVLSILSGQREVVCGIINAGREHLCLQNMVGYFVNSLVVKQVVDPEEEFPELLQRVNRTVLEAFQHQAYPFEMVLDELNIPYPRVAAGFNLFNMQDDTLDIERKDVEPDHVENISNVKFDIIVFATEYKNCIDIFINYKKSCFTRETIEMIADGYKRFLQDVVLEIGG